MSQFVKNRLPVAPHESYATASHACLQSSGATVRGAVVVDVLQNGSHSTRNPLRQRSLTSPAALIPMAHSIPSGALPRASMQPEWIISWCFRQTVRRFQLSSGPLRDLRITRCALR